MYADDRSISYSSKSVSEICNAINSNLQNLSSWLQGNKFFLNVAKTQSMILGTALKGEVHSKIKISNLACFGVKTML